MKQLRAIVIGGGQIGALMDSPSDKHPLTHAGGYIGSPNFDLVAICDTKPDVELNKWHCDIVQSAQEALEKYKPDVVSVAVTEDKQFEVLNLVLSSSAKAVVAEKPLGNSFEEAKKIVSLYEKRKKPLLVNYTRRYSAMFQNLSDTFRSGDERVVSATIRYAKGLRHNGSHAVDLALMLFGQCKETSFLNKTYDFYKADPTISCFMVLEHCPELFLQSLDERCFTLFEVDIFTNRGRYLVNNDHRDLTIWEIDEKSGIPQGKRLTNPRTIQTDYPACMGNLIHNLKDVVVDGHHSLCSGKDAIQSLEIIESIGTNREV